YPIDLGAYMKTKTQIRLGFLGAFVAFAGIGAVACGDDDVVGTPDAGTQPETDSGTPTPDTGTDPDTGATDAGQDVVVVDKPDGSPASWPIVGGDPDTRVGFGTSECNTCVRANCCELVTACYRGGDDAGTVNTPDGTFSGDLDGYCAKTVECYA